MMQAAPKLREEQQDDPMQRLFHAKLGASRLKRKALLQQVQTGAAETPLEASARLAAVMGAAQQPHDNSAAEFRSYMQLTAAYCRGVLQSLCT